jgi:hypothetical protein
MEVKDRTQMDENELTPDQKTKLNSFLAENPEASEQTALRFLIGRKWELERVRKLYANYVKTVKEKNLANITITDVLPEMRTQKMYLPGTRAKDESALLVIWGARHKPGEFKTDDTIKLAYYLNQVHVGEDPVTMRKGLCVIVNLEGVSWANSDVAFLKSVIDFFTDNIPASVKHIIVWRAPWWISMLAKMILPFLKEKMRQRILITDEAKDLQDIIDSDKLPSEFPGGQFQYDHKTYVEKELTKMSTAQMSIERDILFKSAANEPFYEPPQLPGAIDKMISDDIATELLKQRQKTAHDLEIKIQMRRASLQEHPGIPYDLAHLSLSKKGRLSITHEMLENYYGGVQQENTPPPPAASSPIIISRQSGMDFEDLKKQISNNMNQEWDRLYKTPQQPATIDLSSPLSPPRGSPRAIDVGKLRDDLRGRRRNRQAHIQQ